MSVKTTRIMSIVLGLFVVAGLAWAVVKNIPSAEKKPVATVTATDKPCNDCVIATYFHGNARCPSCIKIEKWSHESISGAFADDLANKKLFWRTLNVEEDANRHYIDDYKIYTKSLILTVNKGGSEVRWQNLEEVWRKLGDQNQFRDYVVNETRKALSEVTK
jgi:hypothetical protein